MIVFLGSPRGFCAGVVRAIDSVEIALKKYGSPIYVKHQIVHNTYVAKQLEQKGAITVEKISEIPEEQKLFFLLMVLLHQILRKQNLKIYKFWMQHVH